MSDGNSPPPPPSRPPGSPAPAVGESLFHLLGQWAPSAAPDPAGEQRRLYQLASVVSGALAGGGGEQEFGDSAAAERATRLRSAASLGDQRAWSLDADQRRSFMLDSIRRSPPAATPADLQHQEVMDQLRETNLPEFVERLLSDKNQQIDQLEQSVRALAQQATRSASAGDQSAAAATSGLSEQQQPTPEVLRRAARSSLSDPAADLSRPDISMAYQKQESPPSVRPASPGAASEHSWDSAPTEPGLPSRPGSSAGSEPASSSGGGSAASGDSLHRLRAALARKKQLLRARKQEIEAGGIQQQEAAIQPPADSGLAPMQPPASDATEIPGADAAEAGDVSRPHHQLEQLRSRLSVLEPILARLDAEYRGLAEAAGEQRKLAAVAASETQLRLAEEVEAVRSEIQQREQHRRSMEQQLQMMDEQGVPESDPQRRELEERLLITLRDTELAKLEACSKMHEASALLAKAQRQAQQEAVAAQRPGPDSEPASSGYISEMAPESTVASPPGLSLPSPVGSPPHSPLSSPPRSPLSSPPLSCCGLCPARSPRTAAEGYQPGWQTNQAESSDSEGESAFESGVTELHSEAEQGAGSTCGAGTDWQSGVTELHSDAEQGAGSTCGAGTDWQSGLTELHSEMEQADSVCGTGADWRSSCPSLVDEMSGLADMNAEVDRLRARVSDLERELGQRGDAPSQADPEPWLSRLEQERAAWSRERQRLQLRISALDQEQERLRSAAGDGGDTRLQFAYSRYLRAESYRRALCWQKRYLMLLLGGYQETEVMTLRRMTQLTGGAFRADGRRFLTPGGKFRAAVWVAVAVSRMQFLVQRWRSGRRVAAALCGPDPPPPPPVRPPSSTSLVSAASCDAHAELDRLGRIVRDCPTSVPNVQFDVRSLASVSDVCTEDLEPYLARFDALLERQGLPPQPGRPADRPC